MGNGVAGGSVANNYLQGTARNVQICTEKVCFYPHAIGIGVEVNYKMFC